MFNIGMPELILILVVALIILGPKKLPELAKSLGKGLREFQKAADDIKDSFEKDLRKDEGKPSSTPKMIKPESSKTPQPAETGPGRPAGQSSETCEKNEQDRGG